MNGLEVRTRSVPTAAHLMSAGHEVIGIGEYPDGSRYFRFSPDARPAMEAFLLAKQQADARLQMGA